MFKSQMPTRVYKDNEFMDFLSSENITVVEICHVIGRYFKTKKKKFRDKASSKRFKRPCAFKITCASMLFSCQNT